MSMWLLMQASIPSQVRSLGSSGGQFDTIRIETESLHHLMIVVPNQ